MLERVTLWDVTHLSARVRRSVSFFRLFVCWFPLTWFHALKGLERLSCAARVSLEGGPTFHDHDRM